MEPNFILINKPAGWTSFDAVNFLRHRIKIATKNKTIKVGHAGILDPFATGLLIVAVGREATKRIDEFKNLPKTYTATIALGTTSTTGDSTGELAKIPTAKQPTENEVLDTLKTFVGKQLQLPPMHSAKQVGGVRLYKLARQGKTVERQPEEIEIFTITLLSYRYPLITCSVQCSAGTYIRTLAEDIGTKLGTGAYCQALERTAIGTYMLSAAQDPETATKNYLLSIDKTAP